MLVEHEAVTNGLATKFAGFFTVFDCDNVLRMKEYSRLENAAMGRSSHLEHRRKYELHRGCRRLGNAKHIEMSNEARSDDAPPPTGRSRSRHKHRVRYFLPEELVSIVKSLRRPGRN